jgi:hypothetical protein
LWPNFEQYKKALEKWLNDNHPDYLKEVGSREWTNSFTGNHHSAVNIVD